LQKLKNRSKLDIIHDILVSATGGVKKTHIMAKANLSSEQLLDAVRDPEDNQVYRTTHKGVRFLQCCANIKTLIAPAAPVRVKESELLYL
jgi:predicted transcriptional regulator